MKVIPSQQFLLMMRGNDEIRETVIQGLESLDFSDLFEIIVNDISLWIQNEINNPKPEEPTSGQSDGKDIQLDAVDASKEASDKSVWSINLLLEALKYFWVGIVEGLKPLEADYTQSKLTKIEFENLIMNLGFPLEFL